jgi:hypothetical protein
MGAGKYIWQLLQCIMGLHGVPSQFDGSESLSLSEGMEQSADVQQTCPPGTSNPK